MSEPLPVKREMRATRDERERRDERDGRKHRVRQELSCDVRGSRLRKPRTRASRPSRFSRLSRSFLQWNTSTGHGIWCNTS